MTTLDTTAPAAPRLLDTLADKSLFIALPLVFLWFGAMKFTAYEAAAIEGLVANSPLLAMLYQVLSVQAVSNAIGTVELIIAALLALRFVAPKLAAIGAAGAIATFAITLSFFFTTPGVVLPEHGSLAISVLPGQFLLKDVVLLAASIWALRDALRA